MRRREKYGRLSEKDRLEIGDRIWSGQTHAEAAAAVGPHRLHRFRSKD